MNIQTEMIHKGNWDILIILDACRYDFFKSVYNDILPKGELKKLESPATWTLEWLVKTFNDYKNDNIVYISGNPQCHSLGENRSLHKRSEYLSFTGNEHFHKVVDVWNFGWDESIGNTHPKSINKAYMNNAIKHKGKRFILHYNNPHLPYFSAKEKTEHHKYKRNNIENILCFLLPRLLYYDTREMFGLHPMNIKEKLYRRYGMDKIREFYKQDLQMVLHHIKNLVNAVDLDIVITADHGEMLGEKFKYAHPHGNRDKEQIEIPWWQNG